MNASGTSGAFPGSTQSYPSRREFGCPASQSREPRGSRCRRVDCKQVARVGGASGRRLPTIRPARDFREVHDGHEETRGEEDSKAHCNITHASRDISDDEKDKAHEDEADIDTSELAGGQHQQTEEGRHQPIEGELHHLEEGLSRDEGRLASEEIGEAGDNVDANEGEEVTVLSVPGVRLSVTVAGLWDANGCTRSEW